MRLWTERGGQERASSRGGQAKKEGIQADPDLPHQVRRPISPLKGVRFDFLRAEEEPKKKKKEKERERCEKCYSSVYPPRPSRPIPSHPIRDIVEIRPRVRKCQNRQ